MIEGNPTTFRAARENRPQAHRISFAPSCTQEYEDTKGTVEFHAVIWTNAGLQGKALAYNNSGTKTVPVPCGPLSPVLEDVFAKEGRINFFSLDVEGAEVMVLETIDFSKIQIDVLMIEVENTFCKAHAPCEQRDKVRAIMDRAGYKRYSGLIRASDLFVHPQAPYQLPMEPTAPGGGVG